MGAVAVGTADPPPRADQTPLMERACPDIALPPWENHARTGTRLTEGREKNAEVATFPDAAPVDGSAAVSPLDNLPRLLCRDSLVDLVDVPARRASVEPPEPVVHVLLMSSKPEMRRVHARWIITRVQNGERTGILSRREHI